MHLLLVLGKLQILVLIHPHKPLLVLLLLKHHLLLQIWIHWHARLLGEALWHLLHRVCVMLHHVSSFAGVGTHVAHRVVWVRCGRSFCIAVQRHPWLHDLKFKL
jgi:hypothetical protein